MKNCAIVASASLVLIAGAAHAEAVYGITQTNRLISFESSTPGTIATGVGISGLAPNEQILGIDFRPATGELYALGGFSNLYTLDVLTGAATQVGSTFGTPLNGSAFGFDFNPTIDRIRVVSDADQNLVLNPNTGGSTLVTNLFYGTGDANEGTNPNVVGSGYTNSIAGATSTQLFGIDTGLDILVTQANSAGTLGTVGGLNADLNDVLGFDISGSSGIAYASTEFVGQNRSTFWTIDLTTGAGSLVGEIGGGAVVTSIATLPNLIPAPGAALVLAMGAFLGVRRTR